MTHLPETLTDEEAAASKDPPLATCCTPAPTVLELDAEGNVVQGWGHTGDDLDTYPRNPHGIFVDHADFVWIGTYRHHRVMKFTRSGEHVMTIGAYDENGGSDHQELLGGPAGIWVDPATNEAFVADGYRNRRVVVFDGETGAYLRQWGAYGEAPDDEYEYDYAARGPDDEPPTQFSTVHGSRAPPTARSTSPIAARTASRSSSRTAPSSWSARSSPRPDSPAPRSSSCSPVTTTNRGSTSPTARTTRCGSFAATISRSSTPSAAADTSPDRCCARTE